MEQNPIELNRGGILVLTSQGPIQFGSPPETIKDTMLMTCGVPNIFVLPYEHFDASRRISMAEIEFPIYYNYFLKQRKAHIFVNPDHVENLKTMLHEAIFGPETMDIASEVEMVPGAHVPDLKREMAHFRGDRKLEDLVNIRPIPPAGFKIKDVVIIPRKDRGFNLYDGQTLLAEIPAKLDVKVKYDLGATLQEPFIPPKFGVTCLGPSHGFDPLQNTSGFLLWINRSGVMVDPPVNSTSWLRDSNVNPKLIDSIILTHCHADHDSGTFQKILEENRITIYTTPTIMQSFLKKYSALTRIPVSTLLSMFHFHPVRMNTAVNIHGALFNFYYSLHSIPTVGFHFTFRDKTFLYSSDHLNEPGLINQLFEQGVLTRERKDFLLAFPWHFDLIYHEAGIPPLHTPVSFLNSLPPETQDRITVYHIAEKDFPAVTRLKLAKFGIGNTVYPSIEDHEFEEPYQILDVFSRIEIFRGLPAERFKELLLMVHKEIFQRGDRIIEKGTPGDKFFVIIHGNVSVEGVENAGDKVYGTFEYFGEASLVLDSPRSASVIAATTVEAYSIPKDSFLRLIRGTKVEADIRSLASRRDGSTWSAIKSNRYFHELASSQITLLESMMEPVPIAAGETLLKQGEIPDSVYLPAEGSFELVFDGSAHPLEKGELAGNFFDTRDRRPSKTGIRSVTEGRVFRIRREDMIRFLTDNPGVLMKMLFDEKERSAI
jgi:CRP-like cAMP-binding protein